MSQQTNEHLLELWPVTILVRSLENHKEVNSDLLKLFDSYRNENSDGKGVSYVSPDNFSKDLTHPALDVLKTFIMDNIYDVARTVNEKYWRQFKLENIDVDLTGLWFQVCNDHAFHETHVHGNCSWSGVYYVQAGSASKNQNDVMENGMLNGVTRFYGPNMEYGAAGHGDWGNYYLHDHTFTQYPENGTLVIFPSHLKHMVFPYKGEEDRVIVSFHAQVNSKTQIEYKYSFS